MPWRLPLNPDRPLDPLDAEGVEAIHGAVIRLLRDVGIEIVGAEPGTDPGGVLAAFRAAGAQVQGTNVRLDEGLLAQMLAHAPATFTLTPRNPERSVTVGGRHMLFAAVSSSIDSWDIERGKRPGDFETFTDFLKLAQSLNCIHLLGGYPVEPQDIPPPVRHLHCTEASLVLTDKVIHAYPLGEAAVEDVITLSRLAAGLSEREFAARPRLQMNINSVAPLRYDATVLESAVTAARAGQAVIVTPVVMAESAAMPMTAAVALALAEGLAIVALLQSVRPGAPVALGALVSHLAPPTGTAVFGTPDNIRATEIMGQMARRYHLPLRATGGSTSAIPDGQAMAETAASLWSAARSGAAIVYHAAGWIGTGFTASLEKFVMDCEILQSVQRYFEAVTSPRSTEDLVASVLRAADAPGGGVGAPFYEPLVSDWRSYELWREDGALWSSERANRIVRRIIEEYEPPPLDPARREAMADHVARRARRLGYSAT